VQGRLAVDRLLDGQEQPRQVIALGDLLDLELEAPERAFGPALVE
jgi:hypothetical protein